MLSAPQKNKAGFNGMKICAFESRMADLMAKAIQRHGGTAVSAPSMQEIPLEKNPEAFDFGEKLMNGKISAMIFMTGVGARILVEILEKRYAREKILNALSKTAIVVRGPKPHQVMRELKIPVAVSVPEPNTWHEIIQAIEENERGVDLKGALVAVQEYGESNPGFLRELKKKGASVLPVPVYRWALPDDLAPLQNAIQMVLSGEIQAVLFTNAMQARNLFKVADQKGIAGELREKLKKILVASIGPTTSEALGEFKIPVDFEPSHAKMGHLVSELAVCAENLYKEKQRMSTFESLKVREDDTESGRKKRLESPFMRACFCRETPVTPVWLMRQAGRYMKEYRKLREQVSFIELCKNPELATWATVFACEKIQADAAIIFSDLLLILESMGLGLEYGAQDGPMIYGNVGGRADVEKLNEINCEETLGFVFESIRKTRAALNPKTPLIGFSGAPFTLASYILEGGSSKSFLKTKQFMFKEEGAWHLLMEKLSRGIVRYLNLQAEAGADTLQVFDSWIGCLSPEDYRRYVKPHSRYIMENIKKDIPVIHFGTGTGPFMKDFSEAGGHVIGVDFKMDLKEADRIVGAKRALQGNLDPVVLCADWETIRQKTDTILDAMQGRKGYIFNLGHGILPQTPVENVTRLVEYVHEKTGRDHA